MVLRGWYKVEENTDLKIRARRARACAIERKNPRGGDSARILPVKRSKKC